jgi:hypothetical protein
MKLLLSHSQLLNNTCHFSNCQKIFHQYKANSVGCATSNSFSDYLQSFMDFCNNGGLFKIIANPFQASHEDAEWTLTSLMNLGLNSKKGIFFNLCLTKDKYSNLGQKATVCWNSSEAFILLVNKLYDWWIQMNIHNATDWRTQNLTSVLRLTTTSVTSDLKRLASAVQAQRSLQWVVVLIVYEHYKLFYLH